ncbi:MAG: hypothetical protein KF830_09970 [Planctomycetes bacterium]|nr:hypothetical protein [Planctomycetota bacterium]
MNAPLGVMVTVLVATVGGTAVWQQGPAAPAWDPPPPPPPPPAMAPAAVDRAAPVPAPRPWWARAWSLELQVTPDAVALRLSWRPGAEAEVAAADRGRDTLRTLSR